MSEQTRLDKLMAAYRKFQTEEGKRCEEIDIKLADLQAERQVKVADLHEKMNKLEEAIKTEVLSLGHAYVHPDYGKVGYRKGYTKVVWDSKALDDLAETNKRVFNQIKKYRGMTAVDPSIKIE